MLIVCFSGCTFFVCGSSYSIRRIETACVRPTSQWIASRTSRSKLISSCRCSHHPSWKDSSIPLLPNFPVLRHDQFLRQEEMRKRNNMELEEDDVSARCFLILTYSNRQLMCLDFRRNGGRKERRRNLIRKQPLPGHQIETLLEFHTVNIT